MRLRGHDIPAKANIFINLWLIQNDPQVWERTEDFMLESFENNEPKHHTVLRQHMIKRPKHNICVCVCV